MHRMFRGVARIAALTALAVSGGALVAVPPAIADIGADLGLVCSGKAGTYDVALRIDTTVPSSGTVGQPVQMGTIKIDVGLPPELVKAIGASSPAGASTPPVTGAAPSSAPSPALGGVAEIEVAVRQPGVERRGGWPAFALASAPPRGDGAVHLTGSGVAPPVTPGSPGGLSWSAGKVDLSLVPGDTTPEKDAAELALHCAAEKARVLGTVRVGPRSAAADPGAPSPPTGQAAAAQEGLCEKIPGAGTDPRYAINGDSRLMEIYESPSTPDGLLEIPSPGTLYCVKATGFVNIKKTGNAIPVALENSVRAPTVQQSGNVFFGPNYYEVRGYFVNQTYPTPATVLGFGFMPTRAVAKTIPTRAPGSGETDPVTGNIRAIQMLDPYSALENAPERQELRASAYVRVKAGSAEVNGVPIALGDKCMTAPTLFSAQGFLGTRRSGPTQYLDGQTIIAEDLEVPAFSGCGVGEDISPILTATVSGSGNYANAASGRWCDVEAGSASNCVDGAGPLPASFTVKPGGDVTAVAKPFVLAQGDSKLRCDSATMRLHMDRGHWQSRSRLGKGDMSLEGCEVVALDGSVYPVIGKVAQEGSLWLNMLFEETGDGKRVMRLNGVTLNAVVDVDGTRCNLRIANTMESLFGSQIEGPGEIVGTYDNATKTFSIKDHFVAGDASVLKVSPDSTCYIPGFTEYSLNFDSGTGDFVFPPALQITSP
ncbi:DUF6801 domain-containing protein [Actinomadura coerulea]|uniref:DUF6801 domain-containing protein n=1 Tax=Actinomadura coerulea TaxID=46159 RepID=UPI003420D513